MLMGCDLKTAKDEEEEKAEKAGQENAGSEVTATEDLDARAWRSATLLLVYQESVAKLPATRQPCPRRLQKTAKLFRTFGEEYHEKQLEETHIFPAVQKAGGLAAPTSAF